jgi:hypothetical protein
MGALLALIPGKDLFYGGAIIALLLFGVYEYKHIEAKGAAHEIAALQASSKTLTDAATKQVAETAANYATTVAAITEKADENDKASAAQHESDAQRLRDYDAYRSSHPALESAGSGTQPQAAGTPGDNGVERSLSSLEQVALDLAGSLRDDQNALSACMADRDGLTGK